MDSPVPTTQEPSTTSLPAVPAEWPGAFKLYEYARQATRLNWAPLLGTLLLGILISTLPSGFKHETWYWLVGCVAYLVSMLVGMVTTYLFLQSARGVKTSIGSSVKATGNTAVIVDFILASLLVTLLIGLSVLLLVIPVFFVLPRLVLTPYFVIDKDMGPAEAVKASWDASAGNSGKVWGIIGVNVLIALLMFTFIGIPFAFYFFFMYSTAFALLYYYVTANPSEA